MLRGVLGFSRYSGLMCNPEGQREVR